MIIASPPSPLPAKLRGVHLFHDDIATCAQRVRFALAEKGLKRGPDVAWDDDSPEALRPVDDGSYVSRPVSIRRKVNMTPGYAAIQPNMVVPALVHDGVLHIESVDLIAYIDETWPTPALVPRDPARAAMCRRLIAEAKGLHRAVRFLLVRWALPGDRGKLSDELLADLREEVPGIDIEVEQPLAHLISHMVSGVYAQIAIKVFGDDLDKLQQLGEQAKAIVQEVPGVTPPVVEPIRQTPELHIRLRPDDLAYYGVTRSYVAEVLQTALQGRVISQVLEGQRRFDLLVRLEEDHRTDYANLGRLRIDLPADRGQLELQELADVGEGVGPNAINREEARRRIVIRCNTQGRDLASAVGEIKQRLESEIVLPEGYFFEFGGQFESQQRATRLILILGAVSVVGVFIVLMLLFPSAKIVLQILNALPTAFIGGVLALVITGQDLTVASLVGFISLGGIAVRNGILLVTHYVHLMKEEGEGFTKEMVLRGSLERLAPVLMTALTAGIGLVPLVIGGQEPGREILYPVATVILGGLVTSTFCEFLIHPGLFWRFSGEDAASIATATDEEEAIQ